jgi:multidrug transporter EmrE-like cation transporter
MNYHLLTIALVLNSFANIFLKIAAIGDKGTSLRALISNPYAIIGVAIFASNVYFYIQALRVMPISIVYPIMTAASFIIINTYGFMILKEPFKVADLFGYFLILTGIILITNANQ